MSGRIHSQALFAAFLGIGTALLVVVLAVGGDQRLAVGRAALAALPAGVVVAAIVAVLFSRRLAARVRAIAQAAERYAAGDRARPILDFGSDEVGDVVWRDEEGHSEYQRRHRVVGRLDPARRCRF